MGQKSEGMILSAKERWGTDISKFTNAIPNGAVIK